MAWGGQQKFSARLLYSDGFSEPAGEVAWISSSPANVEWAQDGLVRALLPGEVTITAALDGITGTAQLTVLTPRPSSISITPTLVEIPAGSSVRFSVLAHFEDATTQDITPLVAWTVSNANAATPDSTGRVTALAAGVTAVTAHFNELESTAQVHVTDAVLRALTLSPPSFTGPLGSVKQFSAVGTWSDGTVTDLTAEVGWLSSNASVVTVDDARPGLARSNAVGRAQISATHQGITAAAVITVTNAALTQLRISAPARVIPVGASQPLQATGLYSDGTQEDLTAQVSWTTSDSSVGIILNIPGSQGLMTALAPGPLTITASFQGATEQVSFTISDATLMASPSRRPRRGLRCGRRSSSRPPGITRTIPWWT